MNKINFSSPGGFPLDTDILNFMQDAYTMLNHLGHIAGDLAIIKGCQQLGAQVTDGYVFIDGELLPFRGGHAQPNVVIIEDITEMTYQDGSTHPVEYKRYATFGTGIQQWAWADFKTVYPFTSGLFVDEVRMYAGDLNNIPEGWYLCDGNNGTVDLRGRFVVGHHPGDTDYDSIGKTGGAKAVVLSVNEMPAHDHNANVSTDGYHQHSAHNKEASGDWCGGCHNSKPNSTSRPGHTSYAGSHTHNVTIGTTGGGQAHENRPPYYTLAYIQFKGI